MSKKKNKTKHCTPARILLSIIIIIILFRKICTSQSTIAALSIEIKAELVQHSTLIIAMNISEYNHSDVKFDVHTRYPVNSFNCMDTWLVCGRADLVETIENGYNLTLR